MYRKRRRPTLQSGGLSGLSMNRSATGTENSQCDEACATCLHTPQRGISSYIHSSDGTSSPMYRKRRKLTNRTGGLSGPSLPDPTDTEEMGNAASKSATGTENRQCDEACAICLHAVQDRKTLECRHSFCTGCIDACFKYMPACPICKTFYGIYTGTQPEGTMRVTRNTGRLLGFDQCKTIVIHYHFPAGIQGSEHPNPGVMYGSTSRTAYLPASKEGEEVLKLLRKAFERRLVFTVGQSATTGRNNSIIWNDIHHKTNLSGGPQRYGYPDPEYLSRVREELRLKGVTTTT